MQVVRSLQTRTVQRLTRTFLTLSVEDIARHASLDSGNEAEKMLFRMVRGGPACVVCVVHNVPVADWPFLFVQVEAKQISVSVDKTTGIVSFEVRHCLCFGCARTDADTNNVDGVSRTTRMAMTQQQLVLSWTLTFGSLSS